MAHAIDARDKTGIYIVPGSLINDRCGCKLVKEPGFKCVLFGVLWFLVRSSDLVEIRNVDENWKNEESK